MEEVSCRPLRLVGLFPQICASGLIQREREVCVDAQVSSWWMCLSVCVQGFLCERGEGGAGGRGSEAVRE